MDTLPATFATGSLRMRWPVLAIAACAWLVLAIVALATEAASPEYANGSYVDELDGDGAPPAATLEDDSGTGVVRDMTLGVLLLCLAVIWTGAALGVYRRPELCVDLRRADLGGHLMVVGGAMLAVEITARLLSSDFFAGRASAFDFGLKCPAVDVNCTKRNAAFRPEFNSFGHCVQGCLALFLFPSALGVRGAKAVALEAVACWMIVYPTYNIIKRTLLHGSSFAASSFANNGAEWAMGFVLGMSVWMLGAVWLGNTSCTSGLDAKAGGGERGGVALKIVRALRMLCGVVLCVVATAAAVLFGVSWRNTNALSSDGGSYVDPAALVLMLLIPAGAGYGLIVLRRPAAGCGASHEHDAYTLDPSVPTAKPVV